MSKNQKVKNNGQQILKIILITKKMYHHRFIALSGILAVLLVGHSAYGQDGDIIENPFTNFSMGARNVSLANSNISESYDVSNMYENPATLAFMETSSIFLNHSQGTQSNGTEENLAYPLFLPGSMVIAFGGELYQAGYFPQYKSYDERIIELGYDVAFAGAIIPSLSFGGVASVRHGTDPLGWGAWGAHYTFGLDYAPTGDVSYGLVYDGLGTGLAYPLDSNSSLVVPKSVQMTKTLTLGAAMRYPSSESLRSPILILSMASEKMFGTKGIFYRGGIEIRPIEFLQLRFGYMMGPGIAEPRYGFGIVEHLISVEYAVYPQASIIFQQFSFSMEL